MSITLGGRLIVIVEDEPSVLGGLEVLLKGWGASLASFDNAAQAITWAQTCEPGQAAPDLLIVDYRLEGGRTGVQVITSMRQRFGDNLPAVVVTGSTMSNLEQEALDHHFHLLTKPVVPNKLRAMIAFKLGSKPG